MNDGTVGLRNTGSSAVVAGCLLPDIIKAIENMVPSNEMFADYIRQVGLDLLSRLHIREGMKLCVSTIEMRWGNDFQKRLDYLLRNGVHAKEVLPELRNKRPESAKEAQVFDKVIADIEASTYKPTLVTLEDFIAEASAGNETSKDRKREGL